MMRNDDLSRQARDIYKKETEMQK
eukprot:SAG31_NODE_46476_length_254_cov_0.800000_2_plen_23_part_01